MSDHQPSLERPIAPNPYDYLPQVASFQLTSSDVTDGQPLADAQVADKGNTSPQLSWSGAPEGTQSYVVTCYDPDAPTPSGWWHWVVADIPAEVTSLDAGAGDEGGANLPEGAFMLAHDGGAQAFGGAAPPQGDHPHRYFFVVHAVDKPKLGIDADATPAKASFFLATSTLGRAIIHGTYAH